MSSLTVQDIIDDARAQHWSFADRELGDGAALRFLNRKNRELILDHGTAIEGLVNTTVKIATTLNAVLVGVDANGNPQYLTTYQDGWSIHKDVNGVPFVDFTEAPIAGDPFGQNGGTPGFPLPTDFIKVIGGILELQDNSLRECKVIMERDRTQYLSLPGFRAFISGNRIVPLRAYNEANLNAGDLWSTVSSVTLSYVGSPVFAALTDHVTLPAVLCGALTAHLARFLAMQSPKMPAAEKAGFVAAAEAADATLSNLSTSVLNEMAVSRVKYRG